MLKNLLKLFIVIIGVSVLILAAIVVTHSINKIDLKEAKELAKDCKIKEEGVPHDGDVLLTLIDGSNKNLSKTDKEYNELINSSKVRCGFEVQTWIE